MKERIIEELRKGNLYDFIANEGWKLDKETLIDIIKELDFAMFSYLGENLIKNIENLVADELEERE